MNCHLGWIAYHAQRRSLVSLLTARFLVTALSILCGEPSLWSICGRRLVAIVAVLVELRFKLFDPCFVFFDDSQKRLLQIIDQRDDRIRPSPIGVENLLAPNARKIFWPPPTREIVSRFHNFRNPQHLSGNCSAGLKALCQCQIILL